MDNKVGNKFLENFRENALLIAVFYFLLPIPSAQRAMASIVWMVVAYLVFGSLLWRTIESIRKDKILFTKEKVLFVVTLCMEGVLMAIRPFVAIPNVVEWIAIVWGFLLIVTGFVCVYLYPALEKKGKWNHTMTAKELTVLTVGNYITMAVAFFAVIERIHIG